MIRISTLFLTYSLLITTTHITSMEVPKKLDWQSLFTLPKEVEASIVPNIIAYCECKYLLRQTCTYLSTLASRKNEAILKHPWLRLTEKALNRFALYYAALGNSAIVLNLLNKGVYPHVSDSSHFSMMHYAAQYGYLDIVDALLNHPHFDKNTLIEGDPTPLNLAIEQDQDLVVQRIISACIPTCAINYTDILVRATNRRKLNVIRFLLDNAGIDPAKTDHPKQVLNKFTKKLSGLHEMLSLKCGTCFGKQELTEYILYYGNLGNTEMVRRLLSQSIIEDTGKLYGDMTPIMDFDKVKGGDMLCIAAQKGYVNVVRTLLDCGVDPNSVDTSDLPALHGAMVQASYTPHLPIMKLLISRGALVNKGLARKHGFLCMRSTALHAAAIYNYPLAAQLLIDHGADVNLQTYFHVAPLHEAANAHCQEIFEMLINNGADVNAQDENNNTPLHYMARYNAETSTQMKYNHAMITLLACPTIDVNVQNNNGNTPLHLLVLYHNNAIVEELLKHPSIVINIINNYYKTALDYVSENEPALQYLLIKHGAKTSAQRITESVQENCTIQ